MLVKPIILIIIITDISCKIDESLLEPDGTTQEFNAEELTAFWLEITSHFVSFLVFPSTQLRQGIRIIVQKQHTKRKYFHYL